MNWSIISLRTIKHVVDNPINQDKVDNYFTNRIKEPIRLINAKTS